MKKLILSLFLLMSAVSLGAQTNYYPNTSGTVAGSGYTYKYEKRYGDVILNNTENRFTGVEMAMKDGSPIPSDLSIGYEPTFEKDNWSYKKAFSIVQNAINSLPAYERKRLEGKNLSIELRIDTSTGRVVDVEFYFLDNGPFRYVPITVFRQMELDLKSQIWFTLTPDGKKLNYGIRGWTQKIKFVDDPEDDLILEPVGPPPPKKPKA